MPGIYLAIFTHFSGRTNLCNTISHNLFINCGRSQWQQGESFKVSCQDYFGHGRNNLDVLDEKI